MHGSLRLFLTKKELLLVMSKNNLGKNLLYQLFYQTVILLSPLIVTPYLSRVLGPTELGRYSYVFSVAFYFVLIGTMGITEYGSRQIAAVKDDEQSLNETFSNLFWLHVISATAAAAIYFICVGTIFTSDKPLAYIMGLYVMSTVFDVKWLFYGLENFKITVMRNVIIKVISIVGIFAFVRTRNDVAVYTGIMAGVMYFASEVSLFFLFPRYVKLVKPNWKAILKEISPLLIMFIPTAGVLICRHIDKVMLGMMSTLDQVGLYENTDKVYMMLVAVITTVSDVMLPRMTNLFINGKKEAADKLLSHSLSVCIMTACAFMFGISAISPEFVPLFFGKEFLGCIQLLIYISPTILMLAWTVTVRKQYLIPCFRNNVFIISMTIGAIVNIIANAILIPALGALGAVYGTLIAEFVIVVLQVAMTFKELNYGYFFKQTVIFSFIGAIMFLAVRGVSSLHIANSVLSIAIEIITGALVYSTLAVLYLALSKNDLYKYGIRLVRKRLARKNRF